MSYFAFVSYRRIWCDTFWAWWVRFALERYKLPKDVANELDRRRSLGKCFRDVDELSAGGALSDKLQVKLKASGSLIVICSRRTSESEYVQQEIEFFLSQRGADAIYAIAINGTGDESIPKALRDRIWVDFRGIKTWLFPQKRWKELLRVIADILNVDFDRLWDRKQRAIQFQVQCFTAIAMATFTLLSLLLLDFRAEAIANSVADNTVSQVSWEISRSRFSSVYESKVERLAYQSLREFGTTSAAKAERSFETENKLNIHAASCANYSIVLLNLGRTRILGEVLEYQADPRLRSRTIYQGRQHLNDHYALLNEIRVALKSHGRADAGRRQALIMCLPKQHEMNTDVLNEFTSLLTKAYHNDPDPGVHSSIDWLLRKWGRGELLVVLDNELAVSRTESRALGLAKKSGLPTWYVTPTRRTMILIPPGDVNMGVPDYFRNDSSFPNDAKGIVHGGTRSLDYWFAISTKEVSVGDFRAFVCRKGLTDREVSNDRYGYSTAYKLYLPGRSNFPAMEMTWEIAGEYCRWITEVEQGCILKDYHSTSAFQEKHYRLPTEAEWQSACNAGATTPRFFGFTPHELADYAAFQDTVVDRLDEQRVPSLIGDRLPNRLGLFDVYGNTQEWCLDRWEDNYTATTYPALDDSEIRDRPVRGGDINSHANQCFTAYRRPMQAKSGHLGVGFRVAKTVDFVEKR